MHLDRLQPGEEGGILIERAEPGRVDELERVVVGATINGGLARLVPCACHPVLFVGTESGVTGFDVGVVAHTRRGLDFLWRTRQDGDLVLDVLEDGAGGVAGVGALECYLKAEIEEVILEIDDTVVVGSARDFCLIFARLRKEAGDFDDRSHGDDAGVRGDGERWLLGRASVGASVGLLVGASVGRRLGRERRRDVGRYIGQRQRGSIGRRQSGSIRRNIGQEQCRNVS